MGLCAALGGFFAFNMSLLKPEECQDFLFYVYATTWRGRKWRGSFALSIAPPGAALRMKVGARTHL